MSPKHGAIYASGWQQHGITHALNSNPTGTNKSPADEDIEAQAHAHTMKT